MPLICRGVLPETTTDLLFIRRVSTYREQLDGRAIELLLSNMLTTNALQWRGCDEQHAPIWCMT
jgi:hypothetical protein